jgi:hypothetical protein
MTTGAEIGGGVIVGGDVGTDGFGLANGIGLVTTLAEVVMLLADRDIVEMSSTAPIASAIKAIPITIGKVIRVRRPSGTLFRSGRAHQSQTDADSGFRPPQPGHCIMARRDWARFAPQQSSRKVESLCRSTIETQSMRACGQSDC